MKIVSTRTTNNGLTNGTLSGKEMYTCLHKILSISPSNQILRINNLFNARTWLVMLNEKVMKILGNVRSLHCRCQFPLII